MVTSVADQRPIHIIGGRPYVHEITVNDADGNPYTFDPADTFQAQYRPYASSSVSVPFTIERDGNVLVLALTAAQTTLVARDGLWEVTWTPGGDGEPVPLVATSPVTWEQGVAR